MCIKTPVYFWLGMEKIYVSAIVFLDEIRYNKQIYKQETMPSVGRCLFEQIPSAIFV